MRIVLLRRRYSATGGAENYLERLAKGLCKHGHEITLVCEEWKQSGSAITSIRTVLTSDPADFAQAVCKLQLKNDFDLVFSLERVPGCDLYRAGDGVHAEWLEQRARYSPLLGRFRNWLNPKNRIMRKLESELFRAENTGRIIANSQMIKDSIMQRFGYPADRIDLVYNGVPFERFSTGNRKAGRLALHLADDVFVVLLVGAGRERKGVAYAQAAVSHLPNAKLVVIDQPVSTPLPDIYAAADVFLLPTLYDPFANVTLEAMAAGLPVLTTIHNGASEIITSGKEGFILDRADDIRGMVNHLKYLRDDPTIRRKMGNAAQALARQFTIERNVEETLRICELKQKS
jgi:UDP-glucose:(heptosyl)LPS alpha-1,3-glucosyltransferase